MRRGNAGPKRDLRCPLQEILDDPDRKFHCSFIAGPLRFMKNHIILTIVLAAIWFLWSGHTEWFILGLGVLSCLFTLWLSLRMRILDEEGVPAHLGIRPFTRYMPWLIWEIVKSNWAVAKIIMSRKMPLQRNLVTVTAHAKSELGRVILANSITLTPGTVSVRMDGDQILVHALSFAGAAEDISGDMDRRVQALEKSQ
jgi:multicomponent Na+:H+ antiporter subunit E